MTDLVDQAEHETMRERLKHLKCATMLPGCFDKRFIGDVWQRDPATLTTKQWNFVMQLAWKYRRQIPKHLAPAADPKMQRARSAAR